MSRDGHLLSIMGHFLLADMLYLEVFNEEKIFGFVAVAALHVRSA